MKIKHKKNKENSEISNGGEHFFCVLCWRRVENYKITIRKSKFFCDYHQSSGTTKKNNRKDKDAIYKELEKSGKEWIKIYKLKEIPNKSFYRALSDSLTTISKSPDEVFNKVKINDYSLNETIKDLLKVVSIDFPISFKKINKALSKDFENTEDLMLTIIDALKSGKQQNKYWKNFIPLELRLDGGRWVKLVLNILARYEAYQLAQERRDKPGQQKVDIKEDKLSQLIREKINSNKANGIKNNYKKMGRELGYSGAWIGELAKRIEKSRR
jgi:hypothetical protein